VAAVIFQVANNLISRTRYLSLGEHGLYNNWANLSFLFEFILTLILVYIPGVQFAISTRAIAIPHFMIPALTYYFLIMMCDEIRRFYLRQGIRRVQHPTKGTMMLFDGWVARNTYY
jgi:hypothetical protein